MQIDLVYTDNCPAIGATRAQLMKAFAELGVTPRWREWKMGQPELPDYALGYGSPTVFVNGMDAMGEDPIGTDSCCRLYGDSPGLAAGVPPLTELTRAMRGAGLGGMGDAPSVPWRLNGAALPAILVALVPKVFCPACWPAYAGLMGSLGIGFIDYTPFLLPLTALFLLIALGGLAWKAPERRGFGPLVLGCTAAAALLISKFRFDSEAGMYGGLLLLLLASLWNTWPWPRPPEAPCPTCSGESHERIRLTPVKWRMK